VAHTHTLDALCIQKLIGHKWNHQQRYGMMDGLFKGLLTTLGDEQFDLLLGCKMTRLERLKN
jgi:hypothetical protein